LTTLQNFVSQCTVQKHKDTNFAVERVRYCIVFISVIYFLQFKHIPTNALYYNKAL